MRRVFSELVVLMLMLSLTIAFSGCGSDDPDGANGDGDSQTTDGDTSVTDGDSADTDGDGADGDNTDGDTDTSDGDGEEILPTCETRCLTTPDKVDFGALIIPPGDCATKDVQIESTGQQPVTVIDVHLTGDSSREFKVSTFTPSEPPSELPPGYVLTVSIEYCPTDIEEDQGTLVIGSNDAIKPRIEVPVIMNFKGSVQMLVTPVEIDYGDQDVDTRTREFIRIEAVADDVGATRPLEVSTVTLINSENPNFEMPLGTIDCGEIFYIAPDESVTCPVDFTPTTAGTFTETVTIIGNDYFNPRAVVQVPLNGVGIAPDIQIEPTAIDFGHVLTDLGGIAEGVTITNPGSGPLSIGSLEWISNSNNNFVIESNPVGHIIQAHESLDFGIRFDPDEPGVNVGTLTITSSATTTAPVQVSVTGIGEESCPPGMAPDLESENEAQCIIKCTPGEHICVFMESGWGYQICQDDGITLADFTPCDNPAHICIDGICQPSPCTAGQTNCYIDPDSGRHFQRMCSENGTGWDEAEECVSEDPCQPNRCLDPNKLCQVVNAEVGTPCDDGKVCTENDYCNSLGICEGLTLSCNDDNPCTDDACYPGEGCRNTPNNNNTCSDHNACTDNDHCSGGECIADPSSFNCDDDNPCTADACDPDGNPPCTHTPIAGTCDDGSICTRDDVCCNPTGSDPTCAPGTCIPGPLDDCDDGNDCTDDVCSPQAGCRHNQRTGVCEDGDPCTVGDICGYVVLNYVCIPGDTLDCDDDNPCTADGCDMAGGCEHTPIEGIVDGCDDRSVCTEGDHCCTTAENQRQECQLGECIFGSEIDCEDDDVCTTNYCHPTHGCQFISNNEPCDDDNPCTVGDTCGAGTCQPGLLPYSCDDNNDCTSDVCDPHGDPEDPCEYSKVPDSTTCNDQNTCTDNDHCVNGECVASSTIDCNDNNPCTEDGCDEDGCTHDALIGEPCDDENPCTAGDSCGQNGICVPGQTPTFCPTPEEGVEEKDLACRNYWCQNGIGCRWTAINNVCNNGNICTVNDFCVNGVCSNGPRTYSCDDGNPCTEDTCIDYVGCQHTPIAGSCDDGDSCTENDYCSGGQCQPGLTPRDCSDTYDCTTDYCADNECQHDVNAGTCLIGATCYVNSNTNPLESCQVCDHGQDATGWSDLPDDTSCTPTESCTTVSTCQGGFCDCDSEECLDGFVNLNGDWSDGCEYECTKTAEYDEPDLNGIDVDCDGIDGEVSLAIFVSSTTGSPSGAGTWDDPLDNLQTAINTAYTYNINHGGYDKYVITSIQQLNGEFTLKKGVDIYGGYNQYTDGPGWGATEDGNYTTIQSTTNPGFLLDGFNTQTIYRRIHFKNNMNSTPYKTSYALYLKNINSGILILQHCMIESLSGFAGENGINGTDSTQNGGNGGEGQDAILDSSNTTYGGNGGSSPCDRVGYKGGNGGYSYNSGGDGYGCTSGGTCNVACASSSCSPRGGYGGSETHSGGTGYSGYDGSNGSNGNGGAAGGYFASGFWYPKDGQNGTDGQNGQGGGGGGGGGGENDTGDADDRGAGGGGGGGGGCAGTAGTAGTGGGGSFAVFCNNADPNISYSVIRTGSGGNGGRGGDMGSGSLGGSGGRGGYGDSGGGGGGGSGGDGGDGGYGGYGGGGAGGDTYGIYRYNASYPTYSNITWEIGSPGEGGSRTGAPANSIGVDGNTGNVK